ncbi:MAG: L-threonate dehydrogenase [Alphaproteobacteria bacterium]
MSSHRPVAVIGLGAIGLGTAQSLVRAGIETWGCDVRAEVLARFVASGGKAARTPAEAGRVAGTVIVMVVNAAQTRAVLFGEDGLASTLAPDAVVCLSVTMAPQDAVAIGKDLAGRGLRMVDAPTSGGAARADSGKTTYIVSGPSADVDAALYALEATSEHIFRVGDTVGQAMTVKTVHQLLAGVNIATSMEAMALGMKMGVSPQVLFDVVSACAGNSYMFQNRVPHMLAGDYTPLSAVEIFVKDLGLVLDTGRAERIPLPIAAAAHQLYLAASGSGYGQEDDAAVIKVYADLAGIDLPQGKKA